jgi:L-amino acid N-acyltransferase YncA
VLGWAAVSSASDRCAYAGVVEHSVYVDPSAWGRGIGLAPLRALLVSTDAGGVWKVRSELFPGKAGSRALYRRAGFREVGVRERAGKLRGRWRDVLFVEHHSRVAGIA